MTVDDIITDVIRRERPVYTNIPGDHGGPTKFGITLRTLRVWRASMAVTEADVENLTEAEARAIYRKRYVDDPGFEQLTDDWLRAFMVDTGVLQGVRVAIKLLQRAVDVPVDGILGPVTISAVATGNIGRIRQAVMRERIRHLAACALIDVPAEVIEATNLKFLRGWLNRATSFL